MGHRMHSASELTKSCEFRPLSSPQVGGCSQGPLMAGESLLSPLNRQHNGLRAKRCGEQVWAFHG